MKSYRLLRTVSVAMICSVLFACSACSKKPVESSAESTPASTSETIATVTTPSTTQTTLPVYSGPLATSDTTETSWTEQALTSDVTLYATVSSGTFLRVRKGPGKNYEIAGTLTRGQAVVVCASTSDGWYKTKDGYYVSGQYLKTTAP